MRPPNRPDGPHPTCGGPGEIKVERGLAHHAFWKFEEVYHGILDVNWAFAASNNWSFRGIELPRCIQNHNSHLC